MSVLLARVASLIGYPELVRELGGDPESLMSKVGLDMHLLDDLDQMMSSDALSELLDQSAVILNCPCFGLLLSQRQGITILGPVGLIMRQQPTFLGAISALQKYLHLHSEAGSFNLELVDELAIIKYFPNVKGEGHSRQITDLSLGVGCNVIRLYSGKAWKPRAVYLQHKMPPDLSPYTMVFRSPISFVQEFSGLVFDARILKSTVDHFEPEMQRFLGGYLDGLDREKPQDIVQQVKVIIRGLLSKRHCSLKDVAGLVGLKERSLQRRLKIEGVTFQLVLDQTRKELTADLLKDSDINLTSLAQRLGYAELSVFSRAFKLWFGMTPTEYLKGK
mgnify:CR=1 FL=1